MYCGKTADWIWVSFGVVSGVGRGTGVLDRVEIVEGEKAASLGEGINVHPLATNRDFVAFSAVRGGDAALPKLLWDF